MGPVRWNPIQRTVRTAHLSVLMTVHNFSTQYNTEQFYIISPLTSRQTSVVVCWRRRDFSSTQRCAVPDLIFTGSSCRFKERLPTVAVEVMCCCCCCSVVTGGHWCSAKLAATVPQFQQHRQVSSFTHTCHLFTIHAMSTDECSGVNRCSSPVSMVWCLRVRATEMEIGATI